MLKGMLLSAGAGFECACVRRPTRSPVGPLESPMDGALHTRQALLGRIAVRPPLASSGRPGVTVLDERLCLIVVYKQTSTISSPRCTFCISGAQF